MNEWKKEPKYELTNLRKENEWKNKEWVNELKHE